MIKMMILAPRRPEMTHNEFRRYVTEVHGPLVKSVPEVAAGILRYHYNFPLTDDADGAFGHSAASQFDIVTEAWFASRADQLRNMAEPRYLEIIRPDEGRFADEAHALFHYTHEIPITDGTPNSHKLFFFRRRRSGLTRAEFQSRWRSAFTEIVAESKTWTNIVLGCVQNHALPEHLQPLGTDPRCYDIIDEIFLPGAADLASLKADKSLIERLTDLETELLEPERCLSRITETVRNIP